MNKSVKQNLTKLLVDTTAFIGFLVLMDPRSTGISVHEWLGLAGISVLSTHLLLNWKWIVEITRRFFTRISARSRLNYILNSILFIDMTLIMFSGIMISKAALPALGINLAQSFTWRSLHFATTDLLVPILGLHLALHWSWAVNTTKRFILQPIAGVFATKHTGMKREAEA